MEVSGKLLCLVSSRVEEEDGSYVVEIPESEIDDGDVRVGEVYSVGIVDKDSGKPESSGGGGQLQPPVEEGEIRYVEIEDLGKQGDGIARVERGYVIIVPDAEVGDRVKVEIDEVKENFAVGEVLEEDAFD
ncbi:MAG: TRAM domain-containing protein [Halobacteriales archaeon]